VFVLDLTLNGRRGDSHRDWTDRASRLLLVVALMIIPARRREILDTRLEEDALGIGCARLGSVPV